jgi:hypothetical protein
LLVDVTKLERLNVFAFRWKDPFPEPGPDHDIQRYKKYLAQATAGLDDDLLFLACSLVPKSHTGCQVKERGDIHIFAK